MKKVALLLLLGACASDSATEPGSMFIGGKGDSAQQDACDTCLDTWVACEDRAQDGADIGTCWLSFTACLEGDGITGLCSAATTESEACLGCIAAYDMCVSFDGGPVCWENYLGCLDTNEEVGLCAAEPGANVFPPNGCALCNTTYETCIEGAADGADVLACEAAHDACVEAGDMLVGFCSRESLASAACLACGDVYESCVDDAQDGADVGACYSTLRLCITSSEEAGLCNIEDPAAPDPCDVCGERFAECGDSDECRLELRLCVEGSELVGLCTVAAPNRVCLDCQERYTDCLNDAQDGGDANACWGAFTDCVTDSELVGFCASEAP